MDRRIEKTKAKLPGEPWSRTGAEALLELRVSDETGLSEREVKRRLNIFGKNLLQKTKKRSLWRILIDQFSAFMARPAFSVVPTLIVQTARAVYD